MSLPQQIAAYPDCAELFEKASIDGKGARCFVPDYDRAKLLQMRLHQFRKLDRDEKKRVYPKDDPRWGVSEYDKFTVRNPQQSAEGDGYWVYIETTVLDDAAVEGLSEL